MTAPKAHTWSKEERISSKRVVDKLFNGHGSHAMAAFPLRLVYMVGDREPDKTDEPPVRILVSVPKRCLKHAVDRNRVKRQIRESYRLNKHLLTDQLGESPDKELAMAFIWLSKDLFSTDYVEQRIQQLLQRLKERL